MPTTLQEENGRKAARITVLEGTVEALTGQHNAARARVATLEAENAALRARLEQRGLTGMLRALRILR